jgi:hypothetical protein
LCKFTTSTYKIQGKLKTIAEIVAKKIIEVGAMGVRDPEEISKLAVEQLGVGGPPSV